MDEFLELKYVLVESENFDDYLTFIGIGYFARKVAINLRPVQSLRKNHDGTYSFDFTSSVTSYTITFTPGVEFEEVKPDGVKAKSIITFEGNKMIHIQGEQNGTTSEHVREFYEDQLIVTTTANGFDKTAIRKYQRIY